jgi:hypothetical protein
MEDLSEVLSPLWLSSLTTIFPQLFIPSPTFIQRSARTVRFILFLNLSGPALGSKGIMSKRAMNEVCITEASMVLKRQVSVRGGKEIQPHIELEVLRIVSLHHSTVGIINEGDASSSAPRGGLIVKANSDAVIWELEFDLQSDHTIARTNRQSTKGSSLVPSFRTPNIQLEVRSLCYISR